MFNDLDIPVPEIVYTYNKDKQKEIYDYLSQCLKYEALFFLILFNS